MRRREFLGAASLPLLGCTLETKGNMTAASNPLAPWHMWGTTKQLSLNNAVNVSGQLSKINYKRPDTWSFFFGARLLDVQSSEPVVQVFVVFDVIIGVGRSSFSTVPPNGEVAIASGFAPFRFAVPTPFTPSFSHSKFRTTGRGVNLDDLTDPSPPFIEWLPAQDIQCFARGRVFPSGTARVEVTSYFAPRSHIRPDWLSEGDQFNGGETGGT